jgi:arylsulfatase A-like enzyme
MFRRIFDSPWLYFGLAGLLLTVGLYSQIQFYPPARPMGAIQELETLDERDPLNVVFIVIDMLRSDRLSMYGNSRRTSPVMDLLASTGIRFASVEAQSSWTKASMASMWTAMYPERTGIQRFFHAMPQEAMMPAEIFKEAGYRTAGVWRNGWVASNFGFDQGFDLYIRPRHVRPEHKVTRRSPGLRSLPGTDMDATLSAIEFMTGSVNDPFFLYIHYMDIHQYLYTDLSPDFGTSFSDFYDSAIFWTDYNVGRIMKALQELRIIDKTMVVVVSDHGEAFFEHGIEGHARNLYREVLETPWLIFLPWELEQGIVVEQRVANIDVWPTLLDMLGLQSLPGAEGQSMVPLILDAGAGREEGSEETDRPLYSQLDRSWGKVGADPLPTTSILKGPHRLNYSAARPNQVELYDRSVDPGERQNVSAEQPEVVAALRAEVEAFLAQPKTNWEAAPEVELSEMHQAQLRALGYVIGAPWKGKAGGPGVPQSPAAQP